MNKLRIIPCTYRTACDYVNRYHRHHNAPVGCKFCIAVSDGETIHGVAICGRPVSRYLDNGFTCEILRVCTDGTYNACSMLYGACCRIAKAMGYTKVITYTLISESGTSLKASGFINEGKLPQNIQERICGAYTMEYDKDSTNTELIDELREMIANA